MAKYSPTETQELEQFYETPIQSLEESNQFEGEEFESAMTLELEDIEKYNNLELEELFTLKEEDLEASSELEIEALTIDSLSKEGLEVVEENETESEE